jgi:hypothetical protein
VGDEPMNRLTLWQDRFLGGQVTDSPEGVEVVTKDAVIHVVRPTPWID